MDLPFLKVISSQRKRTLLRKFYQTIARLFVNKSIKIDGLRLSIPSNAFESFVLSPFEPEVKRTIELALKAGNTAIDVGTYIGFHTLLMARIIGDYGKVYAIEPAPDTLDFLRCNMRLNHFQNVKIFPYAAGEYNRLRLFHVGCTSTLNSFYSHNYNRTIWVEERTLDSLIDDPVDFIKIDVEGAELEVLKGMKRILTQNKDIKLIIEWHLLLQKVAGYSAEDLPGFLINLGFQLEILLNKPIALLNLDQVKRMIYSAEFRQLKRVYLFANRVK